MTTDQSTSLDVHVEAKRGHCHMEPKTPPNGGGEAPNLSSERFAKKPSLYVLAGVNGAGKSSVGGAFLMQKNLPWYNPDTYARCLVTEFGMSQWDANSAAWVEGMAQLDTALIEKRRFAFETTLGGHTVRDKLRAACETHRVRVWYCGLHTPDMHVERVRFRVSRGGHDIPREKIFERWEKSRANLVALLPFLAELSIFDNSVTAKPGDPVPEPRRLLHFKDRAILYPDNATSLAHTPSWAQAIIEKALELATTPGPHSGSPWLHYPATFERS